MRHCISFLSNTSERIVFRLDHGVSACAFQSGTRSKYDYAPADAVYHPIPELAELLRPHPQAYWSVHKRQCLQQLQGATPPASLLGCSLLTLLPPDSSQTLHAN